MSDTLIVKIGYPVNHLFKVVSGEVLRKGCVSLFHQREKVPPLHVLEHDEENLDAVARWFNHDLPLEIVLKKFDDARVVHRRQERNFIRQHLLELVQADGRNFVAFDDLDRMKTVCPFVPRQFYP